MSHTRQALRALVPCVMALLGLMAFMAAGAQAQEARILGAKAAASETVQGQAITETLFLVPAQKLTIHCHAYLEEGILLVDGTKHGVIVWHFCLTLQNNVPSLACKPIEPIQMKILSLLLLHNGKNYILVEPEAGKPLTVLKFNEETCALPPENPIEGRVVFECQTEAGASGNCSEELVNHRITPAPAALFPSDALTFGKNPMTLEGVMSVSLSGAKKGCKFSGVI